jgi:hypothetical protein
MSAPGETRIFQFNAAQTRIAMSVITLFFLHKKAQVSLSDGRFQFLNPFFQFCRNRGFLVFLVVETDD